MSSHGAAGLQLDPVGTPQRAVVVAPSQWSGPTDGEPSPPADGTPSSPADGTGSRRVPSPRKELFHSARELPVDAQPADAMDQAPQTLPQQTWPVAAFTKGARLVCLKRSAVRQTERLDSDRESFLERGEEITALDVRVRSHQGWVSFHSATGAVQLQPVAWSGQEPESGAAGFQARHEVEEELERVREECRLREQAQEETSSRTRKALEAQVRELVDDAESTRTSTEAALQVVQDLEHTMTAQSQAYQLLEQEKDRLQRALDAAETAVGAGADSQRHMW